MAPEEQCFLDWQNHRRMVPRMKTTPAGMPMMTGQGSPGDETGVTGGKWGLVSKTERGDKTLQNQV